jgi:hypothetical protein
LHRVTLAVRILSVDLLLKLLSTAATGALDVWVGIIVGVALGLSPILSGAVSIASAVMGVTLVVVPASGCRVGSTAAASLPSAALA